MSHPGYPPPEEGLRRLQAAAAAPAPETVPLDAALGRTLAAAVAATRPQPPFNRAMMDGYALLAARTPGRFPVRSLAAAGGRSPAVPPGSAARILTGAPLPAGTDTVVEQEAVTLEAGNPPVAVVARAVAPGRNVGRRGQEWEPGDLLLAPGQRLGPLEVGLLAALGRDPVVVAGRPRVALVVTGDELAPPGRDPGPEGIWDANTPLFSALVRRYGGEVGCTIRVRDDPAAVEQALETARAARPHLILTTGGVSVGDRDYVIARLRAAGRLLFWRLDLHPGKAVAGAVWGDTPVLALSGSPGAALMGWFLVGAPLLVGLQGGRLPQRTGEARLRAPFPKPTRETRYLRVRLQAGPAGLEADAALPQGSDLLTAYRQLDAFAVIPAGSPPLPAGTPVRIHYVPGLGREALTWGPPAHTTGPEA
ncbi:Molybdopterin molybdenumtransferase [Candidatus Hydrogenisulfobacillus filiaventi]|uniref:Molybdopterin molybdenumtransferase n=1 Tax=Candidatus Hydrogenisulfobacillus filiaventi TaxID=2707344 RepID=A0A6F8ZJQ0_9FIRM|nr:Molybdopterin molybdenumtransferase [Candidatus Hydrogenisulfobacillus filiaventi]